jgi:hypothetical protein
MSRLNKGPELSQLTNANSNTHRRMTLFVLGFCLRPSG